MGITEIKGFSQSVTAGKGTTDLNSPSSPSLCPGTGAPKTRRDRRNLLYLTYSGLLGFAFLGGKVGLGDP